MTLGAFSSFSSARLRTYVVVATLALLLLPAGASEPPRVQVRYNESFLDLPDGYYPYRYRTQVWYRYVRIPSDLVVVIDLTNMGQGDEAIVVHITNCYFTHGSSVQIKGWGDGTSSYDVPASFSRPVHVNISDNVMDFSAHSSVVHLFGVFTARSTILVTGNTYLQDVSSAATSYTQSFVLLEGLWLRDKSQLIIRHNRVTCRLLMRGTDPTSTCQGILITNGFRLDDASSVQVSSNTLLLGAHHMRFIAYGPTAGATLRVAGYSVFTVSDNAVDMQTISALSPLNTPLEAVGTSVAFTSVIVTRVSSLFYFGNSYSFPGSAAVDAVWYVFDPAATAATVEVSERSAVVFSSETATIDGSGVSDVDAFLMFHDTVTLAASGASAVVVERCSLTKTGVSGGSALTFAYFGNVVTLSSGGLSQSALWFDSNTATYTNPPANSAFLTLASLSPASTVASSGVVVKENTCTGCGVFYRGEGMLNAIVDALVQRCNTLNGAALITFSQVTVTSLTDLTVCANQCQSGVDCFAPFTQSATFTTECVCSCTAAAQELPLYGGHCLPGGTVMSLPPLYTGTATLTQSTTPSITATPRLTPSPTDERSSSESQQESATVSSSRSPTVSDSPSVTLTPTASSTKTQTLTETPSVSPTNVLSQSNTLSESDYVTSSKSLTDDLSASPTTSASISDPLSATVSGTLTPSLSLTRSESISSSLSVSLSDTASRSLTLTRTLTTTETASVTDELSSTLTLTSDQTLTESPTGSITAQMSATVSKFVTRHSHTISSDTTLTSTETETVSKTGTISYPRTSSVTRSLTNTSQRTATVTTTGTDTVSISPTFASETVQYTTTETISANPTPTKTSTRDPTATRSRSPTVTITWSFTESLSASVSTSRTQTPTDEPSSSVSESITASPSPHPSASVSITPTDSTSADPSTTQTNSSLTTITTTTSPSLSTTKKSTTRSSNVSVTVSDTRPKSSPTHRSSRSASGATRTVTSDATRTYRSLTFSATFTAPELTGTVTTSSTTTATRQKSPTVLVSSTRTSGLTESVPLNVSTSLSSDLSSATVTAEKTLTRTKTLTPTLLKASKSVPLSVSPTLLPTDTTAVTDTATRTLSQTEERSLTSTVSLNESTATVTLSSDGETATRTQSVSFSAEKPTATTTSSLTESVATVTLDRTGTMSVTAQATGSVDSVSAQDTRSVTLSQQTWTVDATNSSTRSGTYRSKHLHLPPWRDGHLTSTLTSSLTLSVGTRERLRFLDRSHLALGLSVSLTPTWSPSSSVTPTASFTLPRRTISATSAVSMTITQTLTPPPTLTPTRSASVQAVQGGRFLSHFNVFFISSLSFNSCSWAATYFIGPLLLLLLVQLVGLGLWHWRCFDACCRSDRDALSEEPSILRSLFAHTTYGSVLYPCHSSCWALHSLHMVAHVVLVLTLFLFLGRWMNLGTLYTAASPTDDRSSDVAHAAVAVLLTLLGAQLIRPVYTWLAYRFTWNVQVMEAAWRDAVRRDERWHAYLASSDESSTDDGHQEAVVGEVVPANEIGAERVFDKVEWDESTGFATLYNSDDSSGSHSDASSEDTPAFDVEVADPSSVDAMIKFHMDAPAVDSTELLQAFHKQQSMKKLTSAKIRAAVLQAEDVEATEAASAVQGRFPSISAVATAAARLRRQSRKALSLAKKRASVDEGDLIVNDIDVDGLISRYQAGDAMQLPDALAARSKTAAELQQAQEALSGEGPSLVDRALLHHLDGKPTEDLLAHDEEDIARTLYQGTIQDAARRRRHLAARKHRTQESAVVASLLDQHQSGMDLARIDEELEALPDVSEDFLASEVADSFAPGADGELDAGTLQGSQRRASTDDIRRKVKGIIAAARPSRAAGSPISAPKSEADLLIEAHLHGENLDTLESIAERQQRRQKDLELRRLQEESAVNASEKSEVAALLLSFEEGDGPSSGAAIAQTGQDTFAEDPERIIDAFIADPRGRSDRLDALSKVGTSKNAELQVDVIMTRFATEAVPRAADSEALRATRAEVDDLLRDQLTLHKSEETKEVDALLSLQLVQDAHAAEAVRKSKLSRDAETRDVDGLLQAHLEEQKRKEAALQRVEDDVSDVLSYFTRGPAASVSPEASKKRRKKGKRSGRASHLTSESEVPSITISEVSDLDDARRGEGDLFMRRAVPALAGLSPNTSVMPGVSADSNDVLGDALLRVSNPFANRRLALETPRTSPSATPRVQRHADDSTGGESPIFERHFVQSSVELLPDMEATTPMPNEEAPLPTTEIEELWIIQRPHDDADVSLDPDRLVQEDVEVTLRNMPDTIDDIDVADIASLVSRDAPPSRYTTGRPQSGDSATYSLVTSFLFDSNEEDTTGEKKKKKKKKKVSHVRRSSVPHVAVPIPRAQDEFRSLHTAASPGAMSEFEGNTASLGGPKLSLRVLDSLSGGGGNTIASLEGIDDIELPSLDSSVLLKEPTPQGLQLWAGATAHSSDDSGDTETDSSVSHQFEKYCAVDVGGDDSNVYVDLPVTTHHVLAGTALVCVLATVLAALYYVLQWVGASALCSSSLKWELLLALFAIDVCVVDPAVMAVVYAYRFVTSNERNTIWRELHPYDGERRPVLLPPLRTKYKT